jgi:hypothetical protein
MISTERARALQEAGLHWHPASGDAFCIERPGFDGDVFTVSDMTIEPHEFDTGTILGFNGTTEWALDSLALEDALWLPREDQLRDLLGGTFRQLRRLPHAEYAVEAEIGGEVSEYRASTAADAYAEALLALVAHSGGKQAE